MKGFNWYKLFNMKPTEHTKRYVNAILESERPYDLINEYKFDIKLKNDEEMYNVEKTVVNATDVSTIVLTAQLDTLTSLINALLSDDNVIMHSDMEESLKEYIMMVEETLNQNDEDIINNIK